MSSSTTDPRDANLPPFRPYAIITAPADASWYTERPKWARVEPVTTWHGIYGWDREDQNAHEESEFETHAEAVVLGYPTHRLRATGRQRWGVDTSTRRGMDRTCLAATRMSIRRHSRAMVRRDVSPCFRLLRLACVCTRLQKRRSLEPVELVQRLADHRGSAPASCHRVPIMIDVGTRQRNQPAPPTIVFEALTEPERTGGRPWLRLLDDEVRPQVIESGMPGFVVWSSIWPKRPEAVIRFDLAARGGGTDLRWTLSVKEPVPDEALLGHLRKRLNQLINAELRYSFGQ